MKRTLLVAACSMSLSAQSEHFVIIPEGEFRGIDGRPFDAPAWILTPEHGREMVAVLNQRNVDLVIDYEHSTLIAKEKGEPAPAAGWLKPNGFTYVEGVGLCSTQFEWTEKAQGFIDSGEYKYISPVFFYDTAGTILGLHSVALTNTPNLDQLPEAKLAAAAQEFLTTSQDTGMEELLKQIRYFLNLPLTVTADEAVTELHKLIAMLQSKTGIAIAENSQSIFDVIANFETQLAANTQAATPDPTLFVPMAVHQEALAQAATVAANSQAKELDDLIVAACSDGRLTGKATIDWVKGMATTNPDGAKAYIKGLPKIAALSQQQTQTLNIAANHQKTPVEVDATQAAIDTQFGL